MLRLCSVIDVFPIWATIDTDITDWRLNFKLLILFRGAEWRTSVVIRVVWADESYRIPCFGNIRQLLRYGTRIDCPRYILLSPKMLRYRRYSIRYHSPLIFSVRWLCLGLGQWRWRLERIHSNYDTITNPDRVSPIYCQAVQLSCLVHNASALCVQDLTEQVYLSAIPRYYQDNNKDELPRSLSACLEVLFPKE